MSDPFPFAGYLRTLLHLSADAVTVQRLNGGLTNHTARATFTEPVILPGSGGAHQSVIVKHAPPYIAARGPAQALSPQRQSVEAAALMFFSDARQDDVHTTSLGLSAVLRRHPRIRIPKLLYHDPDQHVLIISDLGDIPTLLDYLGTHTVTLPFAADLGAFLADLHTSTLGASADALRPFENPNSTEVLRALIGPLPGRVLKAEGIPDAKVLGEAVELDLAAGTPSDESCFGMVDLWPGSILIGPDFVGLVDWEYAGKSSPGSELGMLTAHLRLPLLSLNLRMDSSPFKAIARFTRELHFAYGVLFRPPMRWTNQFVRSVLLAHGRELINAVDFMGIELEGDGHRTAVISSGVSFLRTVAWADKQGQDVCLGEEERLLFEGLL